MFNWLKYLSRLGIAAFLGASVHSLAAGQIAACPESISAVKKKGLVDYVKKRFGVPSETMMSLTKLVPVEGTCYQQLTFEAKGALTTRDLMLYLSPDGRFLTSELLDTQVDPIAEERRKNEALMAGLTKADVPSLGQLNATVTIVEFSDFQCPFCRNLAGILNQVLPSANHVRLVFHHFPLPGHSWSRMAAEGASCAQLQNTKAFWSMYKKIFDNQQLITPENIKAKLIEYAAADQALDLTAFKSCLEKDLSLGLVFQDMNLASAYDVTGTPTLFINGRRVSGVKSVAQLRALIQQAEAEALSRQPLNGMQSVQQSQYGDHDTN